MSQTMISIAEQFSKAPYGRFLSDGEYSGERFRDELLVPALRSSTRVEVELDGTLGYGSSFLEEAFGGLVRKHHFRADDLEKALEVHSSKPSYQRRVWQYIRDARPE